jgi:hypothetical protein
MSSVSQVCPGPAPIEEGARTTVDCCAGYWDGSSV